MPIHSLGEGATDPGAVWQSLVDELRQAPEEGTSAAILRGFLEGLRSRDPGRVAAMLDAAVSQDGLARLFPFLQTGLPLDQAGTARLHRSLQIGVAPTFAYGNLRWCSFVDDDAASELASLAEAVGRRADGMAVALDILGLHFRSDRYGDKFNPLLVAAGRRLLQLLTEVATLAKQGHMLAGLLAGCTSGQEGEDLARHLCQLACGAVGSSDLGHGLRETVGVLLKTQPDAALIAFLERAGAEKDMFGRSPIENLAEFGPNPLTNVLTDTVLAWCSREPATRFRSAAAAVPYEQAAADGTGPSWTGTAARLLEQAPDRIAVLQCFVERFRPRSWSGSRAAILFNRSQLLAPFERDSDERMAAYAMAERGRLEREADQERRWEAERSRARDEAFEW